MCWEFCYICFCSCKMAVKARLRYLGHTALILFSARLKKSSPHSWLVSIPHISSPLKLQLIPTSSLVATQRQHRIMLQLELQILYQRMLQLHKLISCMRSFLWTVQEKDCFQDCFQLEVLLSLWLEFMGGYMQGCWAFWSELSLCQKWDYGIFFGDAYKQKQTHLYLQTSTYKHVQSIYIYCFIS